MSSIITHTSMNNGNSMKESSSLLQELIDEFDSLSTIENFNRVGSRIKPIYASREKIIVELILEADNLNAKGTLHGGQTASLTDIVTARAVGITIKDQAMASVELAVSYLLPVKVGDTIEIIATVLKIGRNLAFTEAEFRRKSDGKLTAKGKHTLALLPKMESQNGRIPQY